nr:MAG TPA: hypothetical protein [Caudoviricetes sp.]
MVTELPVNQNNVYQRYSYQIKSIQIKITV